MKTTVISECRMSITVCHTYALSILPDLSATDLTDISQSVVWLCLRRYSEMIDASDQRHHKLLTQDMNLCGCPVIGVGGGGATAATAPPPSYATVHAMSSDLICPAMEPQYGMSMSYWMYEQTSDTASSASFEAEHLWLTVDCSRSA